jgi:drug/metabolite transporter (DMT)-like permease
MLRSTLIMFTAMFSVCILKMKLFKHHYFSLVLIMIGLVLVGLSQVFDGGSNNPDGKPDPKDNDLG